LEIFSVLFFTPLAEKRPRTRSKKVTFFGVFSRLPPIKKSQFLSGLPADQEKKKRGHHGPLIYNIFLDKKKKGIWVF
jgi:hypothetical protein